MQAIPGRDGFTLPKSGFFQAAKQYRRFGYSIIPLRGDADPGHRKVAAIAWAEYQHRQPTQSELRHWFVETQYHGLAIVTGSVSRLVVLDFDDLERFWEFERQYPDLARTYNVQTRRGCHLYFQLPPGLKVPSRKVPGVDLLSEGRYVVAPPTSINGHLYKVSHRVEPLTLTQTDIASILVFFNGVVTPKEEMYSTSRLSPKLYDEAKPAHRSDSEPLPPTQDLISLYQRLAGNDGRNNALYKVGIQMRAQGWRVEEAIGYLADVHATYPALLPHHKESYEQRYREAVRTLHSAFNPAARYIAPWRLNASVPTLETNQHDITSLDNSIREHLLQRDKVEGTAFCRVYEGMACRGVKDGDVVTYAQIYKRLKPLGIGRPTIERALTTRNNAGQFLFQRIPQQNTLSPAPPHPVNTEVYKTNTKKQNKKTNMFVPTTNPTRSHNRLEAARPAHRPPQGYYFPGPDQLSTILGIKRSAGDPIQPADLTSPKAYRQGLEREFIRRRPGRYSQGLLAGRLGVSIRTLQRYHRQIPIPSVPTYHTLTQIGFMNLDDIPPWQAGKPSRYRLLDNTGKIYAARPTTAAWLLGKHRRVWLQARGYNFYWYGEMPPALSTSPLVQAAQASIGHPAPPFEVRLQNTHEHLKTITPTVSASEPHCCYPMNTLLPSQAGEQPSPPSLPIPLIARQEEQIVQVVLPMTPPHQEQIIQAEGDAQRKTQRKPKSRRYYRHPLPNKHMEQLAHRIHAFTNPHKYPIDQRQRILHGYDSLNIKVLKGSDRQGMAIYNARRLIETFGFEAVNRTLKKAIWMQERCGADKIYDPAGYLVVASRIEWRNLHPEASGKQVPRFKAEKRRKRKQSYDPDQDAIWCCIRNLILIMEPTYLSWRAAFFASLEKKDPMLEERGWEDEWGQGDSETEIAF